MGVGEQKTVQTNGASTYVAAPSVTAKMLANDTQRRIVRKTQTAASVVSPAPAVPVEDVAARIAAINAEVAAQCSRYPGLKK